MKKIRIFSLFIVIILSGCLYPQSKLTKNEIPNETQIETVQSAVDQYREKTGGLVPIKTKPAETPIFEKYIIDFHLLRDEGFLAELPGNAYENGGYYQYALINPEEDPTVKLIDVRIANILQDIYMKLDSYQSQHTYLPLEEHLGDNYFTIDFDKLGYDAEPSVTSPFSHENLPVIIDTEGKLYVDYRGDLFRELEDNDAKIREHNDIRYILVDHSPFIPVYSPIYTIEDGRPILGPNE